MEAKAALDDAERRAAQAHQVFTTIQGLLEKCEAKREAFKAEYEEATSIGTEETIGKLKTRLHAVEDELNRTLRTLDDIQAAVSVADQRCQAATKIYEVAKKQAVARNPTA